MPRTMSSEYRHRVIRIDVTVMSHFTHLNMRFTGFLALFMRSWYPTIIPKGGCALYTKLRSIHHFKGLGKGCILYTRNYGNIQSGILSWKFKFMFETLIATICSWQIRTIISKQQNSIIIKVSVSLYFIISFHDMVSFILHNIVTST